MTISLVRHIALQPTLPSGRFLSIPCTPTRAPSPMSVSFSCTLFTSVFLHLVCCGGFFVCGVGTKIISRDGHESSTLAQPPPELTDVIDDLLIAKSEASKDFQGLLRDVKDLEVCTLVQTSGLLSNSTLRAVAVLT